MDGTIRELKQKALALTLLLGVGLLGCASGQPEEGSTREGALKAFSFSAGTVRDGRVYAMEGVEAETEGEGGRVFLLRDDGPRVEIDCDCFLEGGGDCFPFLDQDDGPIVVSCLANQGCTGREIDFCVMDISDGSFQIQFEAPLVRARTAALEEREPCEAGHGSDVRIAAGPGAVAASPARSERRE